VKTLSTGGFKLDIWLVGLLLSNGFLVGFDWGRHSLYRDPASASQAPVRPAIRTAPVKSPPSMTVAGSVSTRRTVACMSRTGAITEFAKSHSPQRTRDSPRTSGRTPLSPPHRQRHPPQVTERGERRHSVRRKRLRVRKRARKITTDSRQLEDRETERDRERRERQ
jgi:hypothetical protein